MILLLYATLVLAITKYSLFSTSILGLLFENVCGIVYFDDMVEDVTVCGERFLALWYKLCFCCVVDKE